MIKMESHVSPGNLSTIASSEFYGAIWLLVRVQHVLVIQRLVIPSSTLHKIVRKLTQNDNQTSHLVCRVPNTWY